MADETRIVFDRESADRIAAAVRTVEAGDRDTGPLSFRRAVDSKQFKIQVGTFTGAWSVSTWKTVTLANSTTTLQVYNWTNPVLGSTADTSCRGYVVFGKANGTQSVLEVTMRTTCQTCITSIGTLDLTQVPGWDAGKIQVFGHLAGDTATGSGACLTWYTAGTCATATAA